jgi:hypothetical protein
LSFLEQLKLLLHFSPQAEVADAVMIYIYLPGDLDPFDRYARYEDALENELQAAGLGRVTGGGSMMGEELEDGTCPAVFSGIDVDVTDLGVGRAFLRNMLPDLDCPPGTALHYGIGPRARQDIYDGEAWLLGQPLD